MRRSFAAVVVATLVVIAGCTSASTRATTEGGATVRPPAVSASAAVVAGDVSTRYLLRHLAVAAEHPAGYDRTLFGSDWASQGGGCDTRDRVLIRQAVTQPIVTSDCHLLNGRWISPYDGFTTTNSSLMQVDHFVPVEEAWESGAWRWGHAARVAYYNDLGYPHDLVAVSAHENESKGDHDPQEWLPDRRTFRCRYVAWWVAVKWRWRLAVDPVERAFLRRYLGRRCGWPAVLRPAQESP